MTRLLFLGGVATVVTFAGCEAPSAYRCSSSVECDRANGGTCEVIGACSYPDGECTSGRRYGDLAGTVSNECVATSDDADVDSSPPLDGLIGYWPFDIDGADASGAGHPAELVAGPQFVTGHLGMALKFDGTNYVQIPSLNAGSFPPAGTLTFWVDSQFASATSIVDAYRTDSPHIFLRLTAANMLQFACMNTTNAYPNNAVITVPLAAGLHHVALVWSTEPPLIRMYLDKQERDMKDATGWLGPTGQLVRLFQYLPGTLDELRLYNRILTQQELDALP